MSRDEKSSEEQLARVARVVRLMVSFMSDAMGEGEESNGDVPAADR